MARQTWGHQAEYILTLVGFSVGVGTIWKFPYLCARNGGGSFLIPYFIFILVIGFPLTYLEMTLGQFSRGGPTVAWDLCPAFKGLAFGTVFLTTMFSIYYPVFFAWILFYLFYSFYPTLPWTQCGQPWNTPDCLENYKFENMLSYNNSDTLNQTADNKTDGYIVNGVPSAEEFFRNNMLQITDGLESMGELRWPLVLSLAITFFCVYICIIKGIRLAGKIVYFTVISPYILITVIFIRALTLPGSLDGILFYITPDFQKLKNPNIWLEACSYALYSPGIGYGTIIKMASHNPTDVNCFRDAFLFNVIAFLTNIYFGFSVFGITGHLAHIRGVTMEHFKSSGFKLGFITYPEATSFLPFPQIWSVTVFFMFFMLGIDSLIPPCEVVTDVLEHRFPRLAKKRWLLNAAVIIPLFCLSLPYTAQGGIYLLTLVEWFAYLPSVILFAGLECVGVAWIYGIPRMSEALMSKWGTNVQKGMGILWKYVCPVLLLVLFGYSYYLYRAPQFEDYIYPIWANVMGWCISSALVLPIPVCFVYSVYRASGQTFKEKLSRACKPKGRWKMKEVESGEKKLKSLEDNATREGLCEDTLI